MAEDNSEEKREQRNADARRRADEREAMWARINQLEEEGLSHTEARMEYFSQLNARQAEVAEHQAQATEHEAAAIREGNVERHEAAENIQKATKEEYEQARRYAEAMAKEGHDFNEQFSEAMRQTLYAKEHGDEEYVRHMHEMRDSDTAKLEAKQSRDRIKSALKTAGALGTSALGAAAGAAGAAGRGAKNVGQGVVRQADRVADAADRMVKATVSMTSLWITFIITLGLHIWVVRLMSAETGIESDGLFVLLLLFLYLPLTIYYIFWHRNDADEVREALIITVLTFVAFLIPRFIGLLIELDEEIVNTIFFLVVYIAPWPLFVASKMQEKSTTMRVLFKLWEIGLVIVVIMSTFTFLQALNVSTFSGVSFGGPADVLEGAWEFVAGIPDRVFGQVTATKQIVDRVTNPLYYTGQIEENEEVPLGVEFYEFRSSDKVISNTTSVHVFGTMQARQIENQNFLGESIFIRPGCVIEKEGAPAAAVSPTVMEVVWGTFGQFECEFPALGKYGSYRITGLATFPFQTWAYIEYTFVDDEYARSIARQGLVLNEELDIRPMPTAIYTGGPVVLGMGGVPQPIRVLVNEEEKLPPGTRIGVTLDEAWRNGKITSVEKIELKVPEQYRLENCDREKVEEHGTQDSKEPGYTTWEFNNLEGDGITSFTSVTCELMMNDQAEADKIAASSKAIRTIVAVAYYSYTLEEKTSVQVR